jgi:RNA polymerase sigma-70 factor (ECF subfamily)
VPSTAGRNSQAGAEEAGGDLRAHRTERRQSAVVSTLALPHRAVVIRAYYLGWTTRQIAAELNIAEPVVKSRLHDALRDLRLTFIELAQRSA